MWLPCIDYAIGDCVIAYYLVPEESVYTNMSEILNHLIPQICILSDLDEVYLIGDFNMRTADLKDHIEGVDDMKPGYNVDKIRNNQGIELTEFLKDTRMHIANGRIDGKNGLLNVMHRIQKYQVGIIPSTQEVEALAQ